MGLIASDVLGIDFRQAGAMSCGKPLRCSAKMPRPAPRGRITLQSAAMSQLAAEFQYGGKSRFDRFMDGVNRLPRPMLALGTLGLLGGRSWSDPVWFAARMQGLALVPEPLWWLLGVIVSFYFGARHQLKSQDFQQGWRPAWHGRRRLRRNIAGAGRALRADSPAAASHRHRCGCPAGRHRCRRSTRRWRPGKPAAQPDHNLPSAAAWRGVCHWPFAGRQAYRKTHDYRAWPLRPYPRLHDRHRAGRYPLDRRP